MFEHSTSFDQIWSNKILDRIWYHLLLVKISFSSNTAIFFPTASTASSAERFAGWPKRFLRRRCFSLQTSEGWLSMGEKLHRPINKSGQKPHQLFVINDFLFQTSGRNSVNGWLVFQVASWDYLPKKQWSMTKKSMSLWYCWKRMYNICCKLWDVTVTPNWCSPK